MKERIAVIVPIYNAEKYIEKCVDSIICQTYKDIEIILVDDGSADGSLTVCHRIGERDPRIRVFHKENGGPLSAKRLGVESTSAEYIMFVDADDWMMPNMCERLIHTMTEQNVDLVESGIIRYYSEEHCAYEYDFIREGRYAGESYRTQIIPSMLCNGVSFRKGIASEGPRKIYRKKILSPIIKKADERYGHLFAEDVAVTYPYLLESHSIYVLYECFYFHRQYEDHVAVYVEDAEYEGNLKKLYGYLKGIFLQYDEWQILMRQLDYFISGAFYGKYLYRAQKVVSKTPNMERYLFPYQKVPRGSRVLLYGAGNVGQSYYAQLMKLDYCESIVWEDRKYEDYQGLRLPVQKVDMDVDADYCVIAVQDEQLADTIKDELISLGMNEDKLVWEDPLLNMW